MKPDLIAMEDHSDAYFAWKRAGVKGAWCWHVDAHLDVSRDGLESAGRGDPYVPWGGVNCGNFLYPAIQEGLVGRLTWVVPPHLPQGNLLTWAREHLLDWLDLSVEEMAGLELDRGVVQGTLLGIPFSLGTAEKLASPEVPVLLDVDLDYWVDDGGRLWEEPRLPPLDSLCTTVAFSVYGGFTPPELRGKGVELAGETERPYTPGPLDEAARCLRAREYGKVLELLETVGGDAATYLTGTAHHHLKNFEQALGCWLALGPKNGYVLGLCSEALCALQRPVEALEMARAALNAAPEDYRLYWTEAAAYEKLGDLRQATRSIRRGLQLAEPYVFGLQMRAVLARLYRLQGKAGLAKMELERLERADLLGALRPLTLLR